MLQRIQIERSVGEMARNNMADVRKVQERLNELLDPDRPQLVPDGINGPNTKDLIGDFQKKVVGFANPDRRVDPVGRTISALNDIASREKWKHDPDGPGTWEPDWPEPSKSIDFDKFPKIPVVGPLDHKGGFDSFPPPAQILGPDDFSAIAARDGAWIMVPLDAEREVQLGVDPSQPVQILNNGIDEDGIVSSFSKEPLLRATFKEDRLKLKGLSPCKSCRLDILQNDRHLRIYVSVKPRRVIPIFVFHVQHGPALKSRVSSSELRTILKIANSEILTPQCNIEIDLKGERNLSHKDTGKRLGRVVTRDRDNAENDEWKYLAPFLIDRSFPQPHGAKEVKTVNIFIVREMDTIVKGQKKPFGVRGAMNAHQHSVPMCLLDDRSIGRLTKVDAVARTLAHELGHLLIGALYTHDHDIHQPASHNHYSDALMLGGGSGKKIYRVEIEVMNPTKHKPPPPRI